jgi:ABC-2 type transport system ATP-binding protein
MDGSPAIKAEALTRYYGHLLAVDHINFKVQQGEIMGFLGPNGAGKTTTVRMLTALLEPSEGTALINGYDVSRQAYEAKRQMGLVPEESNVYAELSARGNLIFTAKLYGVPRGERERRGWELLDLFGLREKRDVKARFLSKGMRRRLTIAMGLIHHPAILFLDEPIVGLDVQSAQVIKERVRQLNAEGTTIFLTTHQIEVANQLCDRVAIINHGRIATIDTPEHLKRAFQSMQSVEVAFDRGGPEQREALASLPGVVKTAKQGDKFRFHTADPSALLPQVMAYAQDRGLRVITLNTLGPSLEDVFLAITGREIGTVQHETGEESGRKRGGSR